MDDDSEIVESIYTIAKEVYTKDEGTTETIYLSSRSEDYYEIVFISIVSHVLF